MAILSSSLKVQYDLRPAKQVERRMIVDAFRRVCCGGIDLSTYHYVGMGSFFYVDFSLFHKFLGINELTTVEKFTELKSRVLFNKPLGRINVELCELSTVINKVNPDARYILWAYYDARITASIYSDIVLASRKLPIGSMLLITVDVEPPSYIDGPDALFTEFKNEFGGILSPTWGPNHFAFSQFPDRTRELVYAAMDEGFSFRKNIEFAPLFNFLYADGHQMLTVGGMICSKAESKKLQGCDFSDCTFLRRSRADPPYVIRIPNLTRKERAYLDSVMPTSGAWRFRRFKIAKADLEVYREIYRYMPSYAELLLS